MPISPQRYARIGGALYLAVIAFGVFAQTIRDRVVVGGDATATATRLASMESLWRLSIGAEFVVILSVIGLAVVYYFLLNPVSRELNLVATFIRLIATTVQIVAVIGLASALLPLGHAAYLTTFNTAQRDALIYLAIRAHSQAYGVGLLLFGAGFLFHGRLIYRSGFLPRALGIMIQIAGVCYMTNSLAQFLAPAIQDRIFPLILLPCFVAELSLALWLLIKGVDVDKWRRASGLLAALVFL